ncbi:hypothetical protein [Thermodesulfitimonas sp.]
MSELGVVAMAELPDTVRHRVLTDVLKKREEEVRRYLEARKGLLIHIARRLMNEERLSGEEFQALVAQEMAG